jgi:primosomal protein N' (replication factor Y)
MSTFADVALPVPLRRTFTYRVPEAFSPAVGARVAVSFSGQKLPGIVLRLHDTPPDGVKRIVALAGQLEPEPVFPDELLAFLLRAADYYLAPVGEVLKAAAPPLPRDAIKELKASGFVAAESELKGRSIATLKTLRVRSVPGAVDGGRLGARQRALLSLVQERRDVLLPELAKLVPSARSIVRGLAERGLVSAEEVEIAADPFFAAAVQRDTPFTPTAEQARAIEALCSALDRSLEPRGTTERAEPATYLLHGVTGSGKTEVYLQVVARALEAGRGALVLVPEIALTPQLVARFRARFGEGIACLHSGLSDRERHDAWRALRRGELRLAIGARSALFAPVPRLGVIIVDEEHDPSFKQEEGLRYNGRDMAMLRAHLCGALCVLGSATPSLESFFLAEQGRIKKLVLAERPESRPMPTVELVDLARNRGPGPGGHELLTGPLHRALERCLGAREQAIIFLNRRGFAPSLRCAACTAMLRCPACSVSLTEHRRAALLRCHYCDFATPLSDVCPDCGALGELERVGVGTERIEDAIEQSFPGVRVGRLDRDTAAGRGGVEEVLGKMRARELDVLVGTQMVTKGHDLPGVTLVGVLLADQSLCFPDFRAGERTFQLLAQVAGRAGRAELPGRVLVQTYQPEHYAVACAVRHDYASFYRQEIADRREHGYVPLGRLVAVRADAGDEQVARNVIRELARAAEREPEVASREVQLLGPAPAPIERLRGRHRMRLLLRSRSRASLRKVALAVLARIEEGVAPARAHVDIDPVSML